MDQLTRCGPFQPGPSCGSVQKVWLCWSEHSWAGLFICWMKHISQPGGEILSAGLCLCRKLWKVFYLVTAVRENFAIILPKAQADVMFRLDDTRVNKQQKNLKELLLDRK